MSNNQPPNGMQTPSPIGPGQTPTMGMQPPPPGQVEPKTLGLAIAALVVGIVSFFCFGIITGPVAIVLGVMAMKRIKAAPQQYKGQGLALAGTIIGGVATAIFFIGIMASIAIPNFMSLRSKAYDASALSAARSAKIVEEIYFMENGGVDGGSYADNLSDLLVLEKTLVDDTDVTFIFGDCNSAGYTFTTLHARGAQEHVMTDK